MKDDKLAETGREKEIEVTPEMRLAGFRAFNDYETYEQPSDLDSVWDDIYRAMEEARVTKAQA